MNAVLFFQQLAKKWDDEKKCNSCWTFGAPLSLKNMNSQEAEDDKVCCNHMYVTDYETSSGYTKHDRTQMVNRAWCDHVFTLFVVKQSDLGINTYNEQSGHSIDESLWKTILEPLQNCLGCGNELELCEMGYEFEIFKWNMKVVRLEGDSNHTGWKIMGIFREYTI